ncbi:MAG: phosphatase PAP2 family protein [Pseudomonadota bacterium]|jgi:undecaprenyl-diphosphatase
MAGLRLADLWRLVRRFEAQVLLALVLATGAVLSFLEIGDDVSEGDTHGIDRRIVLLFRNPQDLNDPLGSRNIEEAVRDVTALGGTTIVTMVTILGILAFAFHRRYRHAAVMAGAVLLAWLSSDITKMLFDRPRPDLVPHGAYVYSGSFPSGHSTLATATYLTLAMLVASLEPRRRTKALAYGLAGIVLVGVGLSRVYLGVHWPSDVLAGWCLGSAWALVAWVALRLIGGRTRG